MSNKIILVEDGEILQEETRVAEILNSYFLNITDTLGLDPFFKDTDQNETVANSILRIKEKTNIFHPLDSPMLTCGKFPNRSMH